MAKDGRSWEDGSVMISQKRVRQFLSMSATLQSFFLSLENTFRDLNVSYDILLKTFYRQYVTNMSEEDRLRERTAILFAQLLFDSAGNVTLGDMIAAVM